MEYTEQQRREFEARFARRRRWQLLVSIPVAAMLFAMAFTENRGEGTIAGMPASILGPAFLVVVAGVVVFSLWNWRCPACNAYLGRGISPRFCAKCGVALRTK